MTTEAEQGKTKTETGTEGADSKATTEVEKTTEEVIYGKKAEEKSEDTPKTDPEVEAKTEAETKEVENKDLPESYDFEMPEQFLLPESYLKEVGEFAKENKLSMEQAKSEFEARNRGIQDYFKAINPGGDLYEYQKSKAIEATMKDPVIGGNESKFKEMTELASRGIEKFFSGEEAAYIRDFLKESPITYRPEIIKAFAEFARGGSDDVADTTATQSKPKDVPLEKVFYPNMN